MMPMKRILSLAALALVLSAGSAHLAGGASPLATPAGITGRYIEARTCDIWTGPCFANAEINLTGKHAVLGWQVEKGAVGDVSLDGLGVVAVVAAHDTLGMTQTGKAKAVLIVDKRANAAQRAALVLLAKQQGGALIDHVVSVLSEEITFDICACKEDGCATLSAGPAKIETRCLNAQHDKVCGNECAFFPALARGVKVKPAMAVEHSYQGKGVNETWTDASRRSAYLGSFRAP